MINLIANELPEHEYWGKDFDTARRVLKAIEEAGMFPPEHLFTSGERADHCLQEWESE